MTALYWTTNGEDIWKFSEEMFCILTNMETKEYKVCKQISELSEFVAVNMPPIKKPVQKGKKRSLTKAAKADRKKSKYKGVSRLGKKWRAQAYDKTTKRNIHLGTFDSELLAAAKYQEHIGNHKEAKRLRNEYEEGDHLPETKVSTGMQPGDFMG